MSYDFCIQISAVRKQKIGNVAAQSLGVAFALYAAMQVITAAALSTDSQTNAIEPNKRMAKGVIGQAQPKQPSVGISMPNHNVFVCPNGVFPRGRQIGRVYKT